MYYLIIVRLIFIGVWRCAASFNGRAVLSLTIFFFILVSFDSIRSLSKNMFSYNLFFVFRLLSFAYFGFARGDCVVSQQGDDKNKISVRWLSQSSHLTSMGHFIDTRVSVIGACLHFLCEISLTPRIKGHTIRIRFATRHFGVSCSVESASKGLYRQQVNIRIRRARVSGLGQIQLIFVSHRDPVQRARMCLPVPILDSNREDFQQNNQITF